MALIDIVFDDEFEVGRINAITGGVMVDVCFDRISGVREAITGGAVAGTSYDGNNYAFSQAAPPSGGNIFIITD